MRHPSVRSAYRLLVVLMCAALAACGSDPNSVAEQAKSGDRKGYVSGDGATEWLEAGDRGDPVSLQGPTLDGRTWRSTEHLGKVVVVNVWGSWCPPCVAEMPALQQAWDDARAAGDPVVFIGVNDRESPETARAFVRANKITFPSLAADGGAPLLALQGKASARPTTLLLDGQGRIAARVSGQVSESTLTALVDDALAELAGP